MKASKEIKELLGKSVMRTIQVGSKLHVVVGTEAEVITKVTELRNRGLARGQTIVFEGMTEWYEFVPLFDPSKQGSERYEWHSSGDMVRCWRRHVTKMPDDSIIRTDINKVWKPAAEV